MLAEQDLANLFSVNKMEYYLPKAYKPRYVIPFDDVDGNQWKVSIQEPNFVGSETILTGGEFPVIWEGEGDESQEKVVLGSTGRLSIVCLAGQESLFSVGNIMPAEINDRRVQVLRYMNSEWVIYWQGFIKPETFSQDWNSAPYEIELPIVSAVAAMEYFTMPLPTQSAYDNLFFGVTNIANLIRVIIAASGCDFYRIVTNMYAYRDMTGNVRQIPIPSMPDEYYDMHWTQGTASSLFFYDIEAGVMKPKTFKDVLENICYPYGKINEYGLDFCIMMRKKSDAISTTLFYMMVWDDYTEGTLASSVRFYDYLGFPTGVISMSQLKPSGNENKISIISAPSAISFKNDIDKKKEIFELSEKFIKPSLPMGETPAGLPIVSVDLNAKTRYLYCIDKQYVDLSFMGDIVLSGGTESPDMSFCRVIEVEGNTNTNVSYNKTVPLGFCFNCFRSTATIKFTPKNGFLSRIGRNIIKMTIKCWFIDEEEAIDGEYRDYYASPAYNSAVLAFSIKDKTIGQYLNHDTNWYWSENPQIIPLTDLDFDNDECQYLFNESRQPNDNAPHVLEFTLSGLSYIDTDYQYGQLFLTFKLEYVKDRVFYNDVLMGEFGGVIMDNGNNQEIGGNGESLEINFKTMAGKKQTIDGSMMLPANSFCNSKNYIDAEQREKIEIESARFQRYEEGIRYYDLATSYAVITDGSKVFIPVAVGMNPRMNTLKLTLVSTNVES